MPFKNSFHSIPNPDTNHLSLRQNEDKYGFKMHEIFIGSGF